MPDLSKPLADTSFQCAICFRPIEGESPFCKDCMKEYECEHPQSERVKRHNGSELCEACGFIFEEDGDGDD